MSSKNNKTKDFGKEAVAKKKHGLSKAEKIAIPIILVIAVWAVYSALNPGSPGGSSTLSNSVTTSVSQSGLAPDFTLPVVGPNGLTGQTVTLSSFRGKVVFLEFMEPWCPHCQNMTPILDGLYTQYGKGNVVFLTVAGPWNGATANDAANFIGKYGSSWIYVYDSSGTIFSEYGVNSTPTFYIIGTDGTVSTSLTGEQTSSTLAGAISAAGGT
ncbi:MAG: TlpA disulfide reductase family protein [Candidatus Bathyarchaeia archaeon]